ncbi:hypothetical protein QR680_014535 [Steinernema hermaphroditum]|uniref:Uncharacterized protein n=1 Tax=Steinernema hermaphroditum TaxID=289476 RepID=A0AA39M3C3_9BILA|nr:hypothetical protein QR680_014535 [Steinernema hermaphroditum]
MDDGDVVPGRPHPNGEVDRVHDARYDYYNLLFIKYMIEGDLIPRSHIAEFEVIFGKVKKRAIEMVQDADWIPAKTKSDLVEELTTKRIIFGLPDHLWDLDYIKESIVKVQKRFFELRKHSPILSEADPMNSFIKILGAAYNEVAFNASGTDLLGVRFYSQTGLNFTVKLDRWCVEPRYTHAFDNSTNLIYVCPQPLSFPVGHFHHLKHFLTDRIMIAILQTIVDKTERFFNPEAVGCHTRRADGENGQYADVDAQPVFRSWKHDLIVESSLWLVGDMLLKENSNVTRRVDVGDRTYEFTEAQNFLIGDTLGYCFPGIWDLINHQVSFGSKENFQRTFGCPGAKEEKCHLFY